MGSTIANRVGLVGDPGVYAHRTVDPAAIDGSGQIYWKEVSPGEHELFTRDEDSGIDIVQITSGTGLNPAAVDHGGLAGLADDDHTQYALVAGRPAEDLTVQGGVIVGTIGPTGVQQHTLPAVASDTVALIAASQTLTTKTIDLASNTLTGTVAEFNTALSDGTFAVTANTLAVFAATTSAQLAGVISDETGTGALVFASSPTIVTPTIASFANAGHDHQNAAGGGTLDAAAIAAGTLAQARGGTGLDSSAVTNGQLLIGNTTGNVFNLATLTAGTDISIANAGGSITINSTVMSTAVFTDLNDTPANYTGNALDIVRVNAGETALEFVAEGSDFLTQYALLAGRAGGQTINGGTGAGDKLILEPSTVSGQVEINGGQVVVSGTSTTIGSLGVSGDSSGRRFRPTRTISVPGANDLAIQHASDLDTGINWSAADTLEVLTGQVVRMTFGPTGLVTMSGDCTVAGNLIVEGTTTTVDSETVLVSDNHMYLNAGYVTDAAQTGGLVVNYDPTTTTDTVAGSFVAGVPSTSNPSVTTTGSGTFSVGDFIQISGSTSNDGLFEVLSHTGTTLEVRGVGVTGAVEDFTQNDFVAEAGVGAITKINVSVMRAGTDGAWETASGSSTGLTFNDVVGLTTTQTLTGKTFDLANNTLTGTAAEFDTACSDDDFAYVSDNLSVFAATTSAQLAGVLSDETGTGVFVLADGPTVTSLRVAGTTATSFLELDDGVAVAAPAAGEARVFYDDTDKAIKERHDAGGSNTMARIKTGTYTGDGTTSQGITGIGFQPIYVKIWRRETVNNTTLGIIETTPEIMDDNAAGGAAQHTSTAGEHRFRTDMIISLDADGFTVDDGGTDNFPNASGVIYNYMAIG